MMLNKAMLKYVASGTALVTIGISFGYMYANDTALMDENGDPRICEFSYDNFTSSERQDRIPVCLALQVTDIFTQVFYVTALSVAITGFFKAAVNAQEEPSASSLPTLIGLTVVASLVTVFGRAVFGDVFDGDSKQLDDLEFDATSFSVVFYTNFVYLIIVFLLLVLMMLPMLAENGMFRMNTHMKKSMQSETTNSGGFFGF